MSWSLSGPCPLISSSENPGSHSPSILRRVPPGVSAAHAGPREPQDAGLTLKRASASSQLCVTHSWGRGSGAGREGSGCGQPGQGPGAGRVSFSQSHMSGKRKEAEVGHFQKTVANGHFHHFCGI